MQIGWCAPLDRAESVARAGYDFIEPQLAPLIGAFGLAEAKRRVRAAPLPTPVFGVLLPYGLPVVGPAVDRPALRAHFARAAELLEAAEAEVVVFGSGWGRMVPEGGSRADAQAQFMDAVAMVSEAVAGAGVVVAVEAQNAKETNFVNRVEEAAAVARRAGRSNVRAMADSYHMAEEAEPPAILAAAADVIVHLQLADIGRKAPGLGGYDFHAFFRPLRAAGYAGRASVELMADAPEAEMGRARAYVAEAWAAA
jgi:sugar phosphate isomerase/epimerase